MPQSQQEAIDVIEAFQIYTPLRIRAKLELVEMDVQLDRTLAQDEKIVVELTPWIPNTCTSRSKEMKYHHTIDLYWHMKTLLKNVMTKRNMTYNGISLQMSKRGMWTKKLLS